MEKFYTSNFEQTIYDILNKYNNEALNLMISGGSVLSILDSNKYTSMETGSWAVFYADERCDPSKLNYTASLPFINRLKAKIFPINISLTGEEAAMDYSRKLGNIDVCLLGVGTDGHICSIMPDDKSLEAKEKVRHVMCKNVVSPNRVTVTLEFLNNYVRDLYFVIPPKDGEVKKVTEPHSTIANQLRRKYKVILDEKARSL